MPKPAPWRAVTPIDGEKMSSTAKTAAAAIVTVAISSNGRDFRGINTRASATATPSTTYLMMRVKRSLTSIFYIQNPDFLYADKDAGLKWRAESDFRMATTQPVEDFLSEDAEIPSQRFVLLSFLSPDKILANKDLYHFQQFLKEYEVQWRTAKLEAWFAEQVATINRKLEGIAGDLEKANSVEAAKTVRDQEIRVDRIIEDFHAHVRKETRDATQSKLQTEYDDFLFKNSARLEEEFFKLNNFRTTIRGIKVRGVFSTESEASVRAKRLQKSDPTFNIYAGQVGKWMAWEPDPNKVTDQEYANDQLNTLMKKYRENEDARDEFYMEQKRRRAAAPAQTEGTETLTETTGTNAAAGAGAGGEFDGMFSGPGDLAIQRKMNAAAAAPAAPAATE